MGPKSRAACGCAVAEIGWNRGTLRPLPAEGLSFEGVLRRRERWPRSRSVFQTGSAAAIPRARRWRGSPPTPAAPTRWGRGGGPAPRAGAPGGGVDGRLVDLAAALDAEAAVEFLNFEDPDGRMVYWHSSAHLMAQAVKQLFPQAQLAIGPPIEEGFYYDIDIGRPFGPEDLAQIEERMRDLARQDQTIERVEIPRDEAIRLYQEMGERFKLELLEDIRDARVSFYRQDGFLDMCRGPHLPSTGRIKAIKLLSTSGAYWRGDEHQPMLQRIYGVTFPEPAQLDAYLHQLEEAKRRDHRRLGRELELFAFAEEVGQGLPLWLPRGASVRMTLERYIVDLETQLGYRHVYTPDLADVELYKISGHWEHFRENMYP